jgi:small subunit ribosomal protein S16
MRRLFFATRTSHSYSLTRVAMLSIRLKRIGKKKQPQYRIVVMDKRKDPWADYLEKLGHVDPRSKPKTVVINAERAQYWISKGAQPSDTVWNLFVHHGVITGEKRSKVTISAKRRAKLDARAEKEKAATTKSVAKEATPTPVAADAVPDEPIEAPPPSEENIAPEAVITETETTEQTKE